MNHEYEAARRHAENTLAEVNRHMNKGNIKNPQHHQMLADMAEKATRTISNIDAMENKRPYSDTNIGYGANTRQRGDANEAMRSAMDAVNKILPHITSAYDDDMDAAMDAAEDARYEAEARRGVRGTGRGRRRVRVGGYTRRADMDDMAAMEYNEDRMNDAVARAAADAAAATARHMSANMRGTNDIYPGTPPVMPHNDARYDARSEAAYNARSDARSDADARSARSDDARSDAYRPGPGSRE